MSSNDSEDEEIINTIKMPQSISYVAEDKHHDEDDSQYVDLLIDDCGQVHPPHNYSQMVWQSLKGGNAFTNLLNSFEVSASVLTEFVRLNIQLRDLATLNDLDLQCLGIDNRLTRRQMLKEFAESPSCKLLTKNTNSLELVNLFEHLTNLKISLGPILLRLYENPVQDVLINDRSFQSHQVLQTLHEIEIIAYRLERQLCNLQFNRNMKKAVNHGKSFWWTLLAAGVTSAFGVVYLRNFMRQPWRYSERFLMGHLVPSYPRW